jgi:hypothetical protein
MQENPEHLHHATSTAKLYALYFHCRCKVSDIRLKPTLIVRRCGAAEQAAEKGTKLRNDELDTWRAFPRAVTGSWSM